MREAALLARPAPLPPALATAPARQGLMVQAKSGLGPGGTGAMTAPPIADAGRPLDPVTRGSMESGFGRDFGHVRVHDDARAHDNARGLNARAYAAGDHLVFGEGQYRPQTAIGQALIAHELAHTVQQSGMQMKADGPLPAATNAELETQADRAAEAVTSGRSAPALSRVGVPAVFRAGEEQAKPKAANPAPVPGLPSNWTIVEPDPPNPGTNRLVVQISGFSLPEIKGRGKWVQAAYDAHKPNRLLFSPLFKGKGATIEDYSSVAAYKEGSEKYKDIWLAKYGFTSLKSVRDAFVNAAKDSKNPNSAKVAAIVKHKSVAPILNGFNLNKLTAAKCDIDHIVEKQLQGSSEPGNLQLLGSAKNQQSGRETYQKLVGLVELLKGTPFGGVRDLQLQFTTGITVSPDNDANDGSQIVEETLRNNLVTGKDPTGDNQAGDWMTMTAGGPVERMKVLAKGTTPIDFNFKRIVPGMRLQKYTRAKTAGAKFDSVEAVLDGKLVKASGTKPNEIIQLEAHKAEAPAAAQPAAAGTQGEVVEQRVLKMKAADKKRKMGFYYPYLSPGWIIPEIDASGNTTGTGAIKSSIPMLGEIGIKFGPDLLAATAPLDVKKLNPPIRGFRFTKGSFDLQLSPTFVPSSTVSFEIGPEKKPIIVGDVTAKPGSDGGFVAEGTIRPGPGIPGADSVSGTIGFDSEKGWYGGLKLSSNAISHTKIDASLTLQQKGDDLDIQAKGGAEITVGKKIFNLKAHWIRGGSIAYSVNTRWEKPFHIVDAIQADVYYSDDYLKITGGGTFQFRQWTGGINVTYERLPGGRVKVAGDGHVKVTTDDKKGTGSLDVFIDETGEIWGKGKISYQISPKVTPELEVDLDKDGKLKVKAKVTINNVGVIPQLPTNPTLRPLLRFSTPDIPFPTPIPGVTGFIEFYAGVSYYISFGPGVFTKITVGGEFDPLSPNPVEKIEADADFECPAKVGLEGKFGANAGLKVLMGAGKLSGGLSIAPSIEASAKFLASAKAKYQNGEFMLGMKSAVDLRLDAKLALAGHITASALWGALSHTWDFPIAAPTKTLGSKHVDLGGFELRLGQNDSLPGAESKGQLNEFDPLDIVKDLVGISKHSEAPNPDYDPNARPPRDYYGHNF